MAFTHGWVLARRKLPRPQSVAALTHLSVHSDVRASFSGGDSCTQETNKRPRSWRVGERERWSAVTFRSYLRIVSHFSCCLYPWASVQKRLLTADFFLHTHTQTHAHTHRRLCMKPIVEAQPPPVYSHTSPKWVGVMNLLSVRI